MENSSFVVYTDQNNNKYIIESLANENNITNKGKAISIKNQKYIQVDNNDINNIIVKSNNTKTPINKKCTVVNKKENTTTYDPTRQTTFNIYTDQYNNQYIPEALAYVFKINSKNMVMIEGEKYSRVTADNIKEILNKSNNTRVPINKKCKLVDKKYNDPFIKPIHQSKFFVYPIDDKLYIPGAFAYAYKIHNKGSEKVIGNEIYIQVDKDDIKTIVEKSNYSRIPEYKVYKQNEKTNTSKQFTYYEIIDNKKLCVSSEILELCKKNNIAINEKRRIFINDMPYYEISQESLDEVMKKTNYVGQKQDAKLKIANTMKIYIYNIDGENYIPAGLYSKYSPIEGKKTKLVNGVKYIQVNDNEIENIQKAYYDDGIDTEVIQKENIINIDELYEMINKFDDNQKKIMEDNSQKKTDRHSAMITDADNAANDAIVKDALIIQIKEELKEINKRIEELKAKENEIQEKIQEMSKNGFNPKEFEKLSNERNKVYSDLLKAQSEKIKKEIEYENREMEVYKDAYSKYCEENKDKYISTSQPVNMDIPKPNHDDITKQTVESPTTPTISQEDTQEVLKRINELNEMLKKPNDTLMLPESIKKNF